VPVAAADAGALPELVHAGENGLLSRPGRADELADCLALLCRDARLRARMGRASARIAGEHDRGRVLDRWESLYRALAWPAAGRLLTELSDARP
jgi:glycosyltransferase involved in cell wall biosynthesis